MMTNNIDQLEGSNISECGHKYNYAGMVYTIGRQRPGSGACDVEYLEHYFCEKCLCNEYIAKGIHSNTYEPIKFNATPL